MVTCAKCGKEVGMGFVCNRCGKTFCEKHRLPELHDCKYKGLKSEALPLINTIHYHDDGAIKNLSVTPISRLHVYSPNDEFEDQQPPMMMPVIPNLMANLFLFGFFLVIDVFMMIFTRSVVAGLPLIVHGVFFPLIVHHFLLMKNRGASFKDLIQFTKLSVWYLGIYIITKIIVSLIMLDFITIFLMTLIGIRFVMTYISFSTIMKQFGSK
ncbi:MAG: AN1-type zinc finger domain-containing protein [Promethearchaeota archaeon]